MDIIDFFNNDNMILPVKRDTDSISFLRKRFDDYINNVDSLSVNGDDVSKFIYGNKAVIEETCNKILESLELFFYGKISSSYLKSTEIFEKLKPFLKEMVNKKDIKKQLSCLYRMRVDSKNTFRREEMFHVPFEKRHILSTYRYSVQGTPCLYLSGSSYLCWEEFDRPNMDDVHVVRLEANENVKIIDFGWRPAYYASMIEHELKEGNTSHYGFKVAANYAICWPIIAACSLRVKEKDAKFKEEYIIPQHLTQWIIENNFCDGIRYFSTKLGDEYFGSLGLEINYVFPAKTCASSGFCTKLKSLFKMTEVVSWKYLKSAPRAGGFRWSPLMRERKLELIKGIPSEYISTDWGKIDYLLSNNMPANSL